MLKRLGFVLLAVACREHTAPPVHATAAFVDVTVVAMDGERELAHQTVLVDGDRIVPVGEGLARAGRRRQVALHGQ